MNKWSDYVKNKGYQAILLEHKSIKNTINFIKNNNFFSKNSKLTYIKKQLSNVQKTTNIQDEHYEKCKKLLQEIFIKINEKEHKNVK